GVIFDGVLYNRPELQDRLAPAPPQNDAALVLQAYRRWGAAVLEQMQGLFALLIWDADRDLLVAARDRVGIYPLFYTEVGHAVLFSTSVRTLVGHPRVAGTVNRAALAEQLVDRWTQPDETHLAAVKRVGPGHIWQVAQGQRTTYRYWHALPPQAPVDWVREDELDDQFSVLLNQAVARCLGSGPATLWLSGGLDSATVAMIAADQRRQAGQPLPLAQSLVFPNPSCNEEVLQRGLAAALGLPQDVIPMAQAVPTGTLLETALAMSAAWPVPLSHLYFPPYRYMIQEARAQGYQTILTGSGGDEVLGVSLIYAADLIRSLDFAGLYRLWDGMRRFYPLSAAEFARMTLWTVGLRPLVKRAAARTLRTLAPGRYARRRAAQRIVPFPAWVAADPALRRELAQRATREVPVAPGKSFYVNSIADLLDTPLLVMTLEEMFEFGRHFGVLVQQIFWDADLVAFLFRTPPELLNRGGQARGLIRQPLARRFPHLGFERQVKVNTNDFYRPVLLQEGPRAWHALQGTPALAELGLVDPPALAQLITPLFAGGQPPMEELIRLWKVLSLEVWLQAHL
ncbi:MAG TPA: asparagine synthase-related protein, partial [Chloroflexia bacterium]|nr:asparagine synthase-related protein [Chloroflexia bacterium]